MRKQDFELLQLLIRATAKTLEGGRHATSEDWADIAYDLRRATELAETEEKRLAEAEDA